MALGMITYLDRACIATLAPGIMADLSLSKLKMGYVFSSFAMSYALFGIPAAWLADLKGTRLVLAATVFCWSVFTIGTAAAVGFVSLLVIRFLFGVGEAGAWPCVARTFSRWIPRSERARAQGFFFAGSHISGGLTPFLVVAMLGVMSWRGIFVSFGSVGLIWATVWYRWFRDDPEEHPSVNAAELSHINLGRVSTRKKAAGWRIFVILARSRNIWALCLMYFPNSFVFYFCITWLPTYLREQHGFASGSLVFFTGLPLLLSVVADAGSGVATDYAVSRYGLRRGQCGVGMAAFLFSAGALFATPLVSSPILAATLIALATAGNMFALPAAWNTCIELGGENAAVVGAFMNTSGQVGSFLCPLVVAYALKWYGSWNISIYLMAALFLLGALCWAVIDPNERLGVAKD